MNWDQTGGGATIIPAGSIVNFNRRARRTMELAGTGNLGGGWSFGIGLTDNGRLNVLSGGVLNVTFNGNINSNGATAHALNNSGTINRFGATLSGSPLNITNNGKTNEDARTLGFSAQLINNGTIDVDAVCGRIVWQREFRAGINTHRRRLGLLRSGAMTDQPLKWPSCSQKEHPGEVTEWPKVQHWKCCVGLKPHRGFESRPLR